MAGEYAAVITCRTVKGEERTTALVYGSWAVHQSLDLNDRAWAITQVSTGRALPREHTELLTKKQAITVAKQLDEEFGARRRVTRALGVRIVQIIHRALGGAS